MNSKIYVVLIIISLLLAGCGGKVPAQPTNTAVPAQPTNTAVPAQPTNTATPAGQTQPKPGKWTGTAEFGIFSFTVNPNGTGVTYVEYTFDGYKCAGTTHSGIIGNGQETGWDGDPITNGQFTFTGATMTFKGTFDASGISASGDWTYPDCPSSGTWTATPAK